MPDLPPPTPTDAPLRALLRAYLAAEYRWRDDDHAWHALMPGTRAPEPERRHPGAREFGLLSAWNPHSRPRDAADNHAADARLRDDLARAGVNAKAACARSPSLDWEESGWLLIGATCDACDAFARRYGQLGSLWWRRGDPVGLRMYATRPAGVADDARVTWIGAGPERIR